MPSDSPFVKQLVEHVRWGLDADKDNAAGKKLVAVKALLAKGLADEEMMEFGRTTDPKNEMGLLELVVEAQFSMVRDDATAKAAVAGLESINAIGFKDKKVGFMLNFTAARWCAGPLQDEEKKMIFGKKAIEIGTKMDIAIVDAGANLKAFVRMDGAWIGSIDIAQKKARTARFFDMPTGAIGGLSQPGGALFNIEHSNGGLITFPGGIPITNADGAIIGAIGVCGGSVEDDPAVAEAGVAAVK